MIDVPVPIPVSFEDIEIAAFQTKELGGIIAKCGFIHPELITVMPDGIATVYSGFRRGSTEALVDPHELIYSGFQRRGSLLRRPDLYLDPAIDHIEPRDRLVLRVKDLGFVTRLTQPVNDLQNRYTGLHSLFSK